MRYRPGPLLRAIFVLLLLLHGACLPHVAAAAPLPLTIHGQEDGVHLAPHAEILEDPGHNLDLAQVRAPGAGWRPVDGGALNFALSGSTWWLRLAVVNGTAAPQAMVFDLGTASQDFIHWHVLDRDGAVLLENRSGDRLPFASRLLRTRTLTLPYTLAPRQTTQLYLRFDSQDGLYEIMPLTVSGATAFAASDNRQDLLLTLFHGGLLSLALFNLLLFLATRERNFGLYVLYLAAFLLNSFCFRGYDIAHIWPDAPGLHHQLIAFSANAAFAAGGLFMVSYLRLREHVAPFWHRLALTLIGLNLVGAALGLAGHYMLSSVWSGIFGVSMLALIYAMAVRLLRQRVQEARYVAMAFSSLLIGVTVYYLESAGIAPANGWSNWSVPVGSTIEMLLLAFGLANSLNMLKTKTLLAERAAREAQQALASRLGQLVEERTGELEAANRKLNDLAITDELTTVFNRRHFNQVCALMLDARGRGDPLALCIFDLDNFKAYNDTYGHLAGDDVLRNVAKSVQHELKRSGDNLFRLGGEEFGVLFTAATPDLAQRFIEHLRLTITALAMPHAGNPHGVVSASFGIAWWNPGVRLGSLNANQLYAAADSLLYDAKEAGRNCVLMRLL